MIDRPEDIDPADRLPPRVANALRQDVPIRSEWRAALLDRIAADEQSAPTGRWRVSPAIALAASVAFLLLGAVGGAGVSRYLETRASAQSNAFVVRFVFVAPDAERVSVVGDFDGWKPGAMPLHKLSDGTWITDVPLAPGRYAYAFLVDGALE